MTVTIRQLVPADAAEFRAIRLEALETDPDAFGARHADEAARPGIMFGERLASSVVFAAFADDGIVGMAAFKRHDAAGETHKGFVWGVFVHPRRRRRGVALDLMSALLATADATLQQLTLTVVADNRPAIRLYEQLDFTTYGTEPRAYYTRHGLRDGVLMVRFAPSATNERPL